MKARVSSGKPSLKNLKDVKCYVKSMDLRAQTDDDAFLLAAIADILFEYNDIDRVHAVRNSLYDLVDTYRQAYINKNSKVETQNES